MKFIPITLLVVLANLLSFYPNHNYYSTTFTQHKEGTPEHPLFKVKQSNLRSNQFAGQLKKGTILQIDSSRLHEIKDAKSFKLELDIPFQNQIIQVELHQVNLFADDFKVRTSDRNDPYPVTPGLFYSGHVKNDPKSLVSFSIFEGEVNGIFSLPELGDIALVKTTSAEDEYMVFSDNDLTGTPDKFECLNQDNDTKLNKIRSQVEQHLEERAAGCISVDFEFDDEIYKDFGSNITTVTNWFTSLFNHIKTIYANEQIEITIKSLYIWTTADPYSSTVGTALDQVMASRQNDPSFTGNLHHLVLGYVSQSVGISGVAYVDVLCSRTYRFGTTRLYQYTTWSTFPSTYQWDIGSIAHEIGHNFGSHHTQWCGWTGGPIDNCYAVEGTCSPGPAPVNGGTIMSYCHLSTNYPMSNGFGPLPHTEIYNNFVAATCKSTSCSGIITPTPTCSDGIQNGDETGVDCGGSCVACGGGGGCTLGSNLSQGRITVSQSSTYSNSYPAPAANDGNLSTFNHTSIETSPWWQVDIGSVKTIGKIEVVNRVGCPGCVTQKRLEKFKIFVSNSPTPSNSDIVYTNSSIIGDGQTVSMNITPTPGRYVRIQCDFSAGANYLHIAELRAFECTSTPNICANNQSPTVSVQSNSASYPEKSNFTVSASANDPDGTISSVEFFNGSTSLGVITSAPYTLTINNASANPYSFKAKAIDNCGAITTSNTLVISTTNSCTDGFQNGAETGIDCGGSCVACGGGGGGCTLGSNLSQGRITVSQSSTYSNSYPAPAANDGNLSTFNHTSIETSPWWQVDIGSVKTIGKIEVVNRVGCPGCVTQKRLEKFKIFVSNSPTPSNSDIVYTNSSVIGDGQTVSMNITPTPGRYVRIQCDFSAGANYLHIAELRAFECTSTPNICANNQSPTVSVQSNSASYPEKSNFTVSASANDPDGTISSVEFFNGSTSLGVIASAPYTLTINSASAATYSFTAKALDNCGAITTSQILNISTTNSCTDGFQNGDETGIDCGGTCGPCNNSCTTLTKLSSNKPVTQISTYNNSSYYAGDKVLDGSNQTYNHTGPSTNPWLQIDLQNNFNISSIIINNRSGCLACSGRIKELKIFVSNTPTISNYSATPAFFWSDPVNGLTDGQSITAPLNAVGRYVKIWVKNGGIETWLHLAEVAVMGCPTTGSIYENTQEQINTTNSYTLFPNPLIGDELTFHSNFSDSLENISITIFDLLGRKVSFQKISENKIRISKIQPGAYIVYLGSNGKINSFKIIKL